MSRTSKAERIAQAIAASARTDMQAGGEAVVAVNEVARAAKVPVMDAISGLQEFPGNVWSKLPVGWMLDTSMLADQHAVRVVRRNR